MGHLRSLTGEGTSRVNKELHAFAVGAEKMLQNSTECYGRLKGLTLQLSDDLQKTMGTLAEIESQMECLELETGAFSAGLEEGGWELVGQVYSEVRSLTKDWASQLSKSSMLVTEHLFKAFSYSLLECEEAADLVRQRNKASRGYFDAVNALNARKDQLLDGGDPSSWQMDPAVTSLKIEPAILLENRDIAKHFMLPQDREPLHKLKLVFGYLNQQMVTELSRLCEARARRYCRAFGNWSTECLEVGHEQSRSLSAFTHSLRALLDQLLASPLAYGRVISL